jgi:hypothetical protein
MRVNTRVGRLVGALARQVPLQTVYFRHAARRNSPSGRVIGALARADATASGVRLVRKPRSRFGIRAARKSRSAFRTWVTSFRGILASSATIVAAMASVVAAHQTSLAYQLTMTVNQQRQELQAAGARSAANSTTAPGGFTGGAVLVGGTYLSRLQPTLATVNIQNGAQVMSAKAYPNSIIFSCDGPQIAGQPDVAFDVAGHTLLRAVVGIPDNAQDAANLDETVTFANQSGGLLAKPVVVSLGKPVAVRLNISGVTQLEMTCLGTNTQTQRQDGGAELALGDAYISG